MIILITTIYLLEAEVSAFVVLHVSFGPEALATSLWAEERPLIGVYEHVDPQVLLLGESLAASGFRTLKWLGAVM